MGDQPEGPGTLAGMVGSPKGSLKIFLEHSLDGNLLLLIFYSPDCTLIEKATQMHAEQNVELPSKSESDSDVAAHEDYTHKRIRCENETKLN